MRAVDLLKKKRDGLELSRDEIRFWVHRFSRGLVPDYQVSAFLMAVYFRGMSGPETVALTEAMQTSGALLDLTDLPGRKVDKHSTGGVGDKTSLVVAPAVAAGGLTVPMISGRALAHTGGTLDKLESIPGFQVRLGRERFKEILRDIGVALIGQTDDLVPADRKLYALRDVTATVDSLPLIASSIMSKKLAEGIDGLVLDVKTGSGAFARSGEQAEALARAMVEIGNACRCRTVALITGMDQPLGECVGNSLEVEECVEVLRGRGPEDLRRLCEELAAHCFRVGQAVTGLDAGRELYRKMIAEGRALDKFREVVRLQGGDPAVLDDCSRLPQARHRREIPAPRAGFLGAMDTEKIGWAVGRLGAGRDTVDSSVDHAAGMRLHKKTGDSVAAGEPVCTLYYNSEERCAAACRLLSEALEVADEPLPLPALIRRVIE